MLAIPMLKESPKEAGVTQRSGRSPSLRTAASLPASPWSPHAYTPRSSPLPPRPRPRGRAKRHSVSCRCPTRTPLRSRPSRVRPAPSPPQGSRLSILPESFYDHIKTGFELSTTQEPKLRDKNGPTAPHWKGSGSLQTHGIVKRYDQCVALVDFSPLVSFPAPETRPMRLG